MKPPGILPAAYVRSRYSTSSGKKPSVLCVSLTVTAARTIVSPNCTRADPAACLAMRPLSMTSLRPANVFSTRCIISVVPVWGMQNARVATGAPARATHFALVAESKILDDLAIADYVRPLQVVQQTFAPADHLEETTAAVVVLLVCAEVIAEVVDPLREERHLNACRPGIALV